MTFAAKYGPWALVTGAGRAEGLGFEFASQLAAKGINLILVDVLAEETEERAKEIRSVHGVEAIPVCMDLGRRAFRDELLAAVGEREVGLLVCNHMYSPKDTPTVLDMEPEQLDAMIDINARAYTHLVHAFGNPMVARGRGGIIMETEPVVREVLDALGKRVRVLPGPVNKSLMFVQSRLMSVKAVVNQLGGFMAKGLGKD